VDDLKRAHEVPIGMVNTSWRDFNLPLSIEGILRLGRRAIPDLEKYTSAPEALEASLADACISILKSKNATRRETFRSVYGDVKFVTYTVAEPR